MLSASFFFLGWVGLDKISRQRATKREKWWVDVMMRELVKRRQKNSMSINGQGKRFTEGGGEGSEERRRKLIEPEISDSSRSFRIDRHERFISFLNIWFDFCCCCCWGNGASCSIRLVRLRTGHIPPNRNALLFLLFLPIAIALKTQEKFRKLGVALGLFMVGLLSADRLDEYRHAECVTVVLPRDQSKWTLMAIRVYDARRLVIVLYRLQMGLSFCRPSWRWWWGANVLCSPLDDRIGLASSSSEASEAAGGAVISVRKKKEQKIK